MFEIQDSSGSIFESYIIIYSLRIMLCVGVVLGYVSPNSTGRMVCADVDL